MNDQLRDEIERIVGNGKWWAREYAYGVLRKALSDDDERARSALLAAIHVTNTPAPDPITVAWLNARIIRVRQYDGEEWISFSDFNEYRGRAALRVTEKTKATS